MTSIPMTFRKPGYTYRLVTQVGNVAVYQQKHNESGRIRAHEVLVIRYTTKDTTFRNGLAIPKGSPVLTPCEQWGQYGWTVRTLDDALNLISRKGLAGRFAEPVAEELAA